MNETKKLKADIIIALLSNPNHTPHVENTIFLVKDLIAIFESDVSELRELVETGLSMIDEFKKTLP